MVEVCKVCGDAKCLVVSLGYGCHCQNIRGDPPAKFYGFKEERKEKCPVCESADYYSDPGSDTEPRTQFSLRTPQQTQRFEPATPVSNHLRERGALLLVLLQLLLATTLSVIGTTSNKLRKLFRMMSSLKKNTMTLKLTF